VTFQMEYVTTKLTRSMYSTHASKIAQYGLNSPHGTHNVMRFALCTIRKPTSGCLDQIKDIEINGLESRHLNFGNTVTKRDGLAYMIKHKVRIHKDLNEFAKNGLDDVDNIAHAIDYLMAIPNIGMVKSGFILQMLGFDVACIDSHNLTRLGWKQSQVSIPKTLKYESRIKKIKKYVKLNQIKGTEYWWNSWCDYVAGNVGNRALTTGEAVSEFHVQCVIR